MVHDGDGIPVVIRVNSAITGPNNSRLMDYVVYIHNWPTATSATTYTTIFGLAAGC